MEGDGGSLRLRRPERRERLARCVTGKDERLDGDPGPVGLEREDGPDDGRHHQNRDARGQQRDVRLSVGHADAVGAAHGPRLRGRNDHHEASHGSRDADDEAGGAQRAPIDVLATKGRRPVEDHRSAHRHDTTSLREGEPVGAWHQVRGAGALADGPV